MPSIHFIYSSTSGHTEHVVDTLIQSLGRGAPGVAATRQRAESARPEDLLRGDIVVLGSGTWNYGGAEGQLNEHMHRYLFEQAHAVDLTGRRLAFISLGDDRYYYRTRCTERFMQFLKRSRGKMALMPLIVVNEPYGQEERIARWGDRLLAALGGPPPATATPPPRA